jgi:hypothetical protein
MCSEELLRPGLIEMVLLGCIVAVLVSLVMALAATSVAAI